MLKIAGIILCEMLVFSLLKQHKPELAVFSQLGAAAVLVFVVGDEIRDVLSVFSDLFDAGGVSSVFLSVLIKIIGISLVTQLLSDMCRDSGNSAAATKLEFTGKVIITAAGLPVIKEFTSFIVQLIGNV